MTQKRSRAKSTRAEKAAVPARYEIEPAERRALDDILARREARTPLPRLKIEDKDGISQISPDHPDPNLGSILLMGALGTTDNDFYAGLVGQLGNIASKGPRMDERGLNFMLSVVKGIEPRDEVESMLASQMAAVHMATMTFARRLAHVENIPQQDSAERAFNKLARTFAMQAEALKRYRTGGEQKVTVEHVTVNAGGQAIVGSVSRAGGRGSGKSEEQPHASEAPPASDDASATMPSTIKADRQPMPGARRNG